MAKEEIRKLTEEETEMVTGGNGGCGGCGFTGLKSAYKTDKWTGYAPDLGCVSRGSTHSKPMKREEEEEQFFAKT